MDNMAGRKGVLGLQNQRHKAIGQKSNSFTKRNKLTDLTSAVPCIPLTLQKSRNTFLNV